MPKFVKWLILPIPLLIAASIICAVFYRFRWKMNESNDCANLHQIGLGILLYCSDHHGEFPDTLATLVAQTQLSPICLVDPGSDDTPAEGSTPAEIAAELSKPGHQTFVYLGAGLTDKTVEDDRIIAYEPLSVHGNGSDALFGDGHAQWLPPDQLEKDLAHHATTRASTNP